MTLRATLTAHLIPSGLKYGFEVPNTSTCFGGKKRKSVFHDLNYCLEGLF